MKKFFPYLIFVFVWMGFSYPFFFQGKIPAPLDFLVNFYTPWDIYYDFAVKNPAISDVVSQIIPWKIFSAGEMRAGEIPIWNPNNLSGTPHLGNWQSGVLYPTSLLFILLPIKLAWSLHILLQPLLAGLFMILFLRSLSLSRVSSLVGAVAFSYGGFMTAWLEWGMLGHAILYLPLALLAVDKLRVGRIWLIILLLSMVLSWLAGHPQMSLYVITTVSVYYAFRFWKNYRNKIKLLIIILLTCYVIPLLIAAPQVFPGVQTYLGSIRDMVDGRSWAKAFLIKPYGLLTFLVPDFFGNPVTRNNWGDFSYVEMNGYGAVIVLVLALIAVFELYKCKVLARKNRDRDLRIEKFAVTIISVCLLLAIDNPVSRLIIDLKLPVISSSSPARLIGIIGFWLAVLAARGMDVLKLSITENKYRKVLFPLLTIGSVLTGMWLWTFVSHNPNILIARRNLVWPSLIYLVFLLPIIVRTVLRINRRTVLAKETKKLELFGLLFTVYCLLFTVCDLFRFHHKFIPYGRPEYWYPEVPVITELKKINGRSFGLLEANLNLPFGLATIDGYDPLIQKEFAELTYSEDALAGRNRITGPFLDKGMRETITLISEMGVRWVIQPVIHGANSWELKLWEYPDQFRLDWEDDKYQIFENLKAKIYQPEPSGRLHSQQIIMFRIGLVVSLLSLVGVLGWFKYYAK